MTSEPFSIRHLASLTLPSSRSDLDPADKLALLASPDSAEDPGRVQEAGRARQPVPAASIHRPNYPDGFCLLPLNPSVGIWVKLASLLQFFFVVRLHVLYLSFVNPFFSCFDGIDSFSTSTTTK